MGTSAVVFRVAGEAYALPVTSVREVVADAVRRTLPAPPAPWVTGLASVRGELMPVVDLARRLGVGDAPDGGVLLVIEVRRKAIAVAVEAVDRLVELPARLPKAPPYAGDAAASIYDAGGEIVVVLRPAALVPPA